MNTQISRIMNADTHSYKLKEMKIDGLDSEQSRIGSIKKKKLKKIRRKMIRSGIEKLNLVFTSPLRQSEIFGEKIQSAQTKRFKWCAVSYRFRPERSVCGPRSESETKVEIFALNGGAFAF